MEAEKHFIVEHKHVRPMFNGVEATIIIYLMSFSFASFSLNRGLNDWRSYLKPPEENVFFLGWE